MVPIATTPWGSIFNRLLHHHHGRPSFPFLQHNVCLNLARILNSSTLASATHPHSPIETSAHSNRPSEIVPLRDNEDALRPNFQTFQWLLDCCLSSSSASSTDSQRLHGLVLKSGFIQEHELCTSLIAVYVSGGRLCDAAKVFDDLLLNGLSLPVSIWNKIIAVYAGKKLATWALCLLSRMVHQDCCPDEFTFANVLKACGGSEAKRIGLGCVEQIHVKIIRYGFDDNHLVCNPLIDLYAKNGLIGSAEMVFERLRSRDSATWVAMISGLSQNGCEKQSILLFCEEMHEEGIIPTPYVVSSILSACSKIQLFDLGKDLHALTFKWGLSREIFVCNALISLYCRWGDFTSADYLFRRMQFKDGVSYNSVISGLAQKGHSGRSFEMFKEMQRDCVKPDCVTVASLLSACATVGAFHKGAQLHSYALKSGICLDMIIEGSLLDLYVKCSDVETASKYLRTTKTKNVVLWNVMLVAYGQIGDISQSCQIFSEMQMEGLEPNQYTYPSILRTCTQVGAQDLGEQIHSQAIKTGFQFNLYVCSVLIDMYAKHGNLHAAEKIFRRLQEDDVISWTAMIAGYTQLDMYDEALEHFKEMQTRGIQSDSIGFASAISACSGIQSLHSGQQIQAQSYVFGFSADLSIGNAIVSLYSKCGKVKEAYCAFRRIDVKDNISWNGLISGFAQSGHYGEALKVFAEMNQAGLEANLFTYGSAISAAANTANVKQGKQVHAKLIKTGYSFETEASNALITLYAKCGSIHDTKKIFREMTKRNEVTWNAIITGLSQHGCGREALELFEEMKKLDLTPNHGTFIGILSACSHVGLVEEGLCYFKSMSEEYGLVPKPEHYVCVVDILGRAGFLDRAKKFIEVMPIEPDSMIWRTLLSASIRHDNIEIGQLSAHHLMKLEPEDSATYTLIANMYEVNKKWSNRDMVRQLMKDRGVKKEPGQSWIEVKNSIHAFFAGDNLHPLNDKIYEYLEELNNMAAKIGYVKGGHNHRHGLEKGAELHVHSEKLAITFGLLASPSTIPICVMKNLRVCNDCHSWIKCISMVANRAIVVRDAYRFHHFEGGACSCSDYWLLVQEVPKVVEAVNKQLHGKSFRTKIGAFAVLKELVFVLPDCLTDQMGSLLPGIWKMLLGKSSTSDSKIEVLVFTRLVLASHSPSVFLPHIKDISDPILSAVGERYSKVATEALRVCGELVRILRPNTEVTGFDFEAYVHPVYNAIMARLTNQDQDQEVKECAISCMGLVISTFGDYIFAELPACLPVLVDRMGDDEITRLTTIKAFSVIAASPLRVDLSCVLECYKSTKPLTTLKRQRNSKNVVAELTASMRKANRALRPATLKTLKSIIVAYGDKISSSAYEVIAVELSTLFSDTDLHTAALALEICCTLMADMKFGSDVCLTVRDKVLPQALTLIKSSLLQGQALLALQNFCTCLVYYANTSFESLLDSLLSCAKPAPRALIPPRAVVSQDRHCFQLLNALPFYALLQAEQHLALLCLCEVGKRKDLSVHAHIENIVVDSFKSPFEEIKSAASYALGNIAVGNLSKYIPFVLDQVDNQPKNRYFLLCSVKEVIVRQSVDKHELQNSSVDKIVSLLFNHCESEEEGVRNLVAECLGKIALIEPAKLVPALKARVSSPAAFTRAIVVSAIRFSLVEMPAKIDAILYQEISSFLMLIKDSELHVRRAAVLALSAAARKKPHLIKDLIPELLPFLYDLTVTKDELIGTVGLGPTKRAVDSDLVDLRRAAFECVDTLLDTCLDQVHPSSFILPHLKSGLDDHSDIKMLCHLILSKLAGKCPSAVLPDVDSLAEPLE